MSKPYDVKIKKLPRSMVEITAAIPADEFDKTRPEALRHLGADFELPGFRKGHAPEKLLVAKIGEGAILEEMAGVAIRHAYPKIVEAEQLDVLGRPEIRLTKVAMGNPLEFTLTTALFPVFTLPDYKALAGKIERASEVVVSDDEVNKAIEQIAEMRAKNTAAPEGDGVTTTPAVVDDAFVRTLGDFTGVDDFKMKLRANMAAERARAAKDKRRSTIIEAIIAKTAIDLPEVIVEQETARVKDELEAEVKRMGLSLDAYLKAVKKTEADMASEWRTMAEKRAKVQLVVSKIAEVEHIEPDHELLKREVAALTERYPDASQERAEDYVRMLLTNEKVFELLESEKR